MPRPGALRRGAGVPASHLLLDGVRVAAHDYGADGVVHLRSQDNTALNEENAPGENLQVESCGATLFFSLN